MFNPLAGLRNVFSQSNRVSSNSSVDSKAVSVPVSETKVDSPGRLADAVAPDDKCFDIYHGPTVATIQELVSALREASPETFEHHMHNNGNDFARWVRDVFDDQPAADILHSAGNPSEVIYLLEELS